MSYSSMQVDGPLKNHASFLILSQAAVAPVEVGCCTRAVG